MSDGIFAFEDDNCCERKKGKKSETYIENRDESEDYIYIYIYILYIYIYIYIYMLVSACAYI